MSDKLDPKTIALLIIDPQNDFLSDGGAVWDEIDTDTARIANMGNRKLNT